MIPVHIVTGFLGSGKTSFLRELLLAEKGHETLVIVNELGEIGIDDALLDPVGENTYLLSNGCICCTVLVNIKETLLTVTRQRNQKEIPYFSKVVIETTGLANPATLLNTLVQDTHLKGQFSISGITTLVDLENIQLQSELHFEWHAQVAAANRLVLSKVNSTRAIAVDEAKTILSKVNRDAPIIESYRGTITLSDLFEISALKTINPQLFFFTPPEMLQHQEVKTFVIEFDGVINWVSFGLWLNLLLKKYGEQILRVKGVLKIDEEELPLLVQGVQYCIYPPEHLTSWPWEDEKSRIVFIVRGIDAELIKRSFALFMQVC